MSPLADRRRQLLGGVRGLAESRESFAWSASTPAAAFLPASTPGW